MLPKCNRLYVYVLINTNKILPSLLLQNSYSFLLHWALMPDRKTACYLMQKFQQSINKRTQNLYGVIGNPCDFTKMSPLSKCVQQKWWSFSDQHNEEYIHIPAFIQKGHFSFLQKTDDENKRKLHCIHTLQYVVFSITKFSMGALKKCFSPSAVYITVLNGVDTAWLKQSCHYISWLTIDFSLGSFIYFWVLGERREKRGVQ